jgi:uncharacterized protein YecE (DUF72 family)
VRIHIGTSGYSFPEWRGSFYPEGFPAAQMLRFYGERLDTVEINATFYRMPTEKVLAAWSDEVPESFRFVLKAPRRITHILRLKEASDPLAYFLETAAVLGPRLGPLLFQLPPNFKKDVPRLEAFLSLVPKEMRAAFEFRHVSWFDDEVYAALSSHGAALCLAEDDELSTPFVPTTSWGYLRLRRAEYADDELVAKARAVKDAPWTEAFVFFKHEEEGRGPALARALRERLTPPASLSE